MNAANKIITTIIRTIAIKRNNGKEIDWEQRRYELAKAALQGLCANPTYSNYSWSDCASEAIGCADALNSQLKE